MVVWICKKKVVPLRSLSVFYVDWRCAKFLMDTKFLGTQPY